MAELEKEIKVTRQQTLALTSALGLDLESLLPPPQGLNDGDAPGDAAPEGGSSER